MIRLNRTTEYSLIALYHMHKQQESLSTAREIADSYGLPFEITAKTLQKLRDVGLIQSLQGAKGGYALARPLASLSFGEFVQLVEGPQRLTPCCFDVSCTYDERCEIRGFVSALNAKVVALFHAVSLAELCSLEEEVHVSRSSCNDTCRQTCP